MNVIGNLLVGEAKNIALGQVRTALPVVGGGLGVLGITGHVNPASFEGALYYLASSLFYIVPALFSYLQKKGIKSLVQEAIAAAPGSVEAAVIRAKVS